MNLPKFITFTGADDGTSFEAMDALSRLYPIEWAILLSHSRAGSPRYPSPPWVSALLSFNALARSGSHLDPSVRRMTLAAHLCGSYARAVVDREPVSAYDLPRFSDDDAQNVAVNALLIKGFPRVQVNFSGPGIDTAKIKEWGRRGGWTPILQCRDGLTFPADENVSWLFDISGGEGRAPLAWPFNGIANRLVGFAGGITPENVRGVVERCSTRAVHYWIDMESGVRTDDRFDLQKCRAVCEAVYGQRNEHYR